MTFGWTLFLVIAMVLYAYMAGMMAIFIGCSVQGPLTATQNKLLTSAIFWLPGASVLAALLCYVFYVEGYTSQGYWIVLLPILTSTFYLAMYSLINAKNSNTINRITR